MRVLLLAQDKHRIWQYYAWVRKSNQETSMPLPCTLVFISTSLTVLRLLGVGFMMDTSKDGLNFKVLL